MRRSLRSSLTGRVAFLVAAFVVAACTESSAPTSSEPAPNVLIIVTDDHRLESLSVMPQLRRHFVRGGTNFEQAFVTTPQCCPSRASILSGRYAHNHGVLNNGPGLAREIDQRTLIPFYLRRAGYHTGLFGKYLNKWPPARTPPNFDDFSFFSVGQPYYRGTWNHNGEMVSPRAYSTTYIRRHAGQFLRSAESHDGRPWFLYLATSAPHGPSIAEPRFKNAPVPYWPGNPAVRETDRSDKPPYVSRDNADLARGRSVRRRQLRSLMSVDLLIGNVMTLLNELGENGRTLVFFVSDNGVAWSDHGLRGKNVPYTPSIGVPMMMRWPGRVPAEHIDRRVAANIDIAPTVLDAAGIASDHPMDGASLLQQAEREVILTEYFFMPKYDVPTWASLRSDSFQYIESYNHDGTRVRFREYYDLTKDPWQLENLLQDEDPSNDPDVDDLSRRLGEMRTCAGPNCP